MQHDDARRNLAHEIEVVLDQHHAEAVLADELLQHRADRAAFGLGQPGGRLVEEQDARLGRQHHCELEAALHAVR